MFIYKHNIYFWDCCVEGGSAANLGGVFNINETRSEVVCVPRTSMMSEFLEFIAWWYVTFEDDQTVRAVSHVFSGMSDLFATKTPKTGSV